MNYKRFTFAALFAVSLGSIAAFAQAEIGGYGGAAHLSGGTHAIVGGTAGFHLAGAAQLFGEVNYIPLGSYSAIGVSSSAKLVNFGGGLTYSFAGQSSPLAPYIVVAAGLGHTTASFSGLGSASDNSVYGGFGGGLRYKLGKSWGIRPEVRYQRYVQNGGGNLLLITGGIYYQFGQ